MADFILLETGDHLLLETGDKLLNESSGGAASFTLTATGGSYTLSGTDASLKRTYIQAVAAGSYSITGSSVTFTNLRHISLLADAGAYDISGVSTHLLLNGVAKAGGNKNILMMGVG